MGKPHVLYLPVQVDGHQIVKGIPGRENGRNKDRETGKRKVYIS